MEHRSSFFLRPGQPWDLPELARLFRDTIRAVSRSDYSDRQVDAWAGRWKTILSRWDFCGPLFTLTAVSDGRIVGYGNITADGLLDHLYVHPEMQGLGVATALCDELERYAFSCGAQAITVQASRTARPFFAHRGYRLAQERIAQLDGVELPCFWMQKP